MSFAVSPVNVFWSKVGELRLATLRDAQGRCLQPITDYLDTMAEEFDDADPSSAKSTVEARTYALAWFAEFLFESGWYWLPEKLSDATLRKFRAWALKRVQRNPRSRDGASQEETVNIKLRRIYDFLNWCRRNFLLPKNSIGPVGCRVISTLPAIDETADPSKYLLDSDNKYPLLYKNTGKKNSMPGTGQHWATEEERDRVEDLFWTSIGSVADRNTMMLRILDMTAFRVASANSLTCSQFSKRALDSLNARDFFEVKPIRQKNGAHRTFEIPWALARSIAAYIDDDRTGRESIVKKLAKDGKTVSTDAIFISVRDGAKLTSNYWSTILGDAFKKIGIRKGAAAHALRRGKAQRRAEELIEALVESGVAVTEELVTPELMQLLGHGTKQAQASYMRALRRRRGVTQVDKLAVALENRTLEADRLKAEGAAIKAELERVKAERDAHAKTIAALRKAQERAAKTGATKASPAKLHPAPAPA